MPDEQQLQKNLQAIFKGDILSNSDVLKTYSHDASLLEVKPEVVIFPKDAEDIKAVVRYVKDNKASDPALSVTARSAGTCMSGGSLNDSIIMDINKYMQGILAINKDEATVLPGTFYRDFETETLKYDALMPAFTASKNLCSVGGMVANNSGGEKTLQYGKTELYVKQLKVVLADGNEYTVKPLNKAELDQKIAQGDYEGNIYKKIYELVTANQALLQEAKPKVSKNSAGYYLWNVWDGTTFDLNRLLVGSQGTLCIVTEIVFRLVPIKKHSKLYVIFLKDLKRLSEIVNEVLPFKPESIESYDDRTLKLAVQFLPGIMKSLKPKHFIKFALSFIPEVLMMLTGGIPKLIVLVEFADNDMNVINQSMKDLDDHLKPFKLSTRITSSEEESEKYWTIRHEAFNLLRKHIHKSRTAPFIDDIIVRPEFLPEFIPALITLLDEYKLVYTVQGHVGDGNFHIIPIMDMHKQVNIDVITEICDKVFALVLKYKGSITAEHNDGIVRTPYLEQMFGPEVYELFKQTKDAFDPQNIFNPGKKVGGSKKYLHDHIAHE